MFECRLDAHRTLQQSEYWLEIGVCRIDAVVKLAAFDLGAQKPLALQAGEFARNIGGVGVESGGQLADINARGTVDVKEREQLAAEVGAEGDHCSTIILHLQ